MLGRAGYPFCLEMDAEYQLSEEHGLQVSITARNTGSRPAPYGTGSHPYLDAGAPAVDECTLSLPAARWLPADERGIPAGEARDVTGTDADFRTGRPIGHVVLDHALTGLSRDGLGRAWARLASGSTQVALWAGQGYHWLQVFTGDTLDATRRRRAVAVEPMTCPPNAFATGTDLIILDPGEQRHPCLGYRGDQALGTARRGKYAAHPRQVLRRVDVVGAADVAALHRRDPVRVGLKVGTGADVAGGQRQHTGPLVPGQQDRVPWPAVVGRRRRSRRRPGTPRSAAGPRRGR